MFESLAQSLRLPDLRRRILFTLAILAIYRLAAQVPVPGADRAAITQILEGTGAVGRLGNFLNLMTGGALEQFSVMAMGVYPYITASIIMQLMTPLIPALEELSKEGESGRNKINQWTYWMTIPLCIAQAFAQIALLNSAGGGVNIVEFGAADPLNSVTVLMALTAGTMFALWLGERITEEGLGNGVSIIIFVSIAAQIPTNLINLATSNVLSLVIVALFTVGIVYAIVIIQEGHRRIPVQYGRQVRGQKVYGGQSTFIPLRVNSTGMIPLIFATSLMIFPGVIGSLMASSDNDTLRSFGITLQNTFISGSSWVYFLVYFILVVGFTYFYADVIFRQQSLHETLQRNGGFIPGIRPGQRTESYLTFVLHRITAFGALFLGIVAVIPYFMQFITPGGLTPQQSMIVDSAGLLIVVGVVVDTIKQLQAQLLMRNYEGFIK